MSRIVFDHVSVAFDERNVLNDVSLELTEQRIGIVGANGGGKSTLIRLINGLGSPTAGTVTVDGLDVEKNGKEVRRKVGFVFSDAENQARATIYMQPNIQDSSSKLLEETVVLSEKIKVRNLPILDIQANNIAAAHGAKIYRLDEQKLFYLQSKWLSAQQARSLLISSYPNMLFEDTMEKEEEKEQIIAEFLDFDAQYHA